MAEKEEGEVGAIEGVTGREVKGNDTREGSTEAEAAAGGANWRERGPKSGGRDAGNLTRESEKEALGAPGERPESKRKKSKEQGVAGKRAI
ncbi:hypothetical protein GUJ93_ZPchr0011g28464 [Zizania palustris]|uniref:Uncharacterized protein n=1 Tax=Zizania palustris TaxID=103762 RepID=A0A8J5WFC7_ZIZPA|nr:hypothetical protein GUJ93_ZPchr0011g28464 [Zizania palustris]